MAHHDTQQLNDLIILRTHETQRARTEWINAEKNCRDLESTILRLEKRALELADELRRANALFNKARQHTFSVREVLPLLKDISRLQALLAQLDEQRRTKRSRLDLSIAQSLNLNHRLQHAITVLDSLQNDLDDAHRKKTDQRRHLEDEDLEMSRSHKNRTQ